MANDLTWMLLGVRTRTGNPSTDGFFTDAQLTDFVNEALQVYATEFDWPWLQATEALSTTAGSATGLSPNANWTRTKSLVIDGYDPLEMLSVGELRAIPTTITGVPRYYAIEAEKILLRPVPDAVYSVTHDYFKTEPPLTSGTGEPLLPTQWRYAVIEFACHLAQLRQGNAQGAAGALAGYAGWISRMRDNRRRSASNIKVRVRPGSAF